MIRSSTALDSQTIRINPDRGKLPLFDRTGGQRLAFDAFAESANERVEPGETGNEIYVGLKHLDQQDQHIRRWGKASDAIGTKPRFHIVADIDDIVKKGAFPGLAAYDPRGATGAEETAQNAAEAQVAHRPGPIRPGLRLHQTVLLALYAPNREWRNG